MKIGELASRTGVSVRMLRYYEEEGLLTPARTSSGYRDYGCDEINVVESIKMLGASGMTLPIIRQFLPCAIDKRGEFEPCEELKDILLGQIADVDRKTHELGKARNLLSKLLKVIDNR